ADEFAMMDEAVAVFKNIVDMNAGWRATNKQLKQLFATRTLHAAARVYCGKLILDQGVMAAEKLAELGEDHFDANFYKGKIASARFYVMNVVPEVLGFEKAMKNADTSSIDIAEDSLM
ncbi:MAG: acyl-CoA dehydrogenase C-terminal domain-containing protein, partial [Syntrophomonadaceae bacterium]|nr:acyl-CoA dehydrogenase C-terminal domain-containing protein [Syntrophomonadaceae bacterium]